MKALADEFRSLKAELATHSKRDYIKENTQGSRKRAEAKSLAHSKLVRFLNQMDLRELEALCEAMEMDCGEFSSMQLRSKLLNL